MHNWTRLKTKEICVICGHAGWCCYQGRKDLPVAVLCARIESPKPIKGGQGWVHILSRNHIPSPVREHRLRITPMETPCVDMPALARQYQAKVNADLLDYHAAQLGVTVDSLHWLGVGYCGEKMAWSFPMRDGAGNIIGIRLRKSDGFKWCVEGSHNGLFVSHYWPSNIPLFVVEGPTDTAAMLSIGLDAIGKPNNTGGHDEIMRFAGIHRNWSRYVLVLDRDEGIAKKLTTDAAYKLASSLTGIGKFVKIITPPCKDMREWVKSGATKEDVFKLVVSTSEVKELKAVI